MRAQLFQQQVALVEQRGLVAGGIGRARQAQVDLAQLGGDAVDAVDAALALEAQLLAHRIQAVGGDVEGFRHGPAAFDHGGAQRSVGGIGEQLLQPGLERDDGVVDPGSTAASMFSRPWTSAPARAASAPVRRISDWRKISALRTTPETRVPARLTPWGEALLALAASSVVRTVRRT